jgi:hypothetical protein
MACRSAGVTAHFAVNGVVVNRFLTTSHRNLARDCSIGRYTLVTVAQNFASSRAATCSSNVGRMSCLTIATRCTSAKALASRIRL